VAYAFVMALLPKPPTLPGQPGDKVQHMIAFFTLATFAAAGWRERGVLPLFGALAIFGAAIEIFQMIPALHRDAELLDWLADMAASLVALLATRLVLPKL
jgi:VanZ family protein